MAVVRKTMADLLREAKPGKLIPRGLRRFPFTPPSWPASMQHPPEHSDLGADYDTDWARTPGARAMRTVLQESIGRPALAVLTQPKVIGTDRLDRLDGPVIFAANHQSHLDTTVLLLALPRRFRSRCVVAAGADYFFDTHPKAAMSALMINAIPIERKKVSRLSSDRALELIKDDWSVIIFPEGGRSPDGWGQDFKPGAAFSRTRRPICFSWY